MAWLVNRDEWLRIYKDITRKLPSLNFQRDQEATDLLSNILLKTNKGIEVKGFFERISSREVAIVVGCGESVYSELKYLKTCLNNRELLVVAANGATKVLLETGLLPDLVVTDLDGDFYSLVDASSKGAILVVHAHGDNIDKLNYITAFKGPIVGSTQVEPRPLVYNFGGFTDGDRAVFVLYHAGYREVVLVGFDFEKPHTCPGKERGNLELKATKLAIAKTLVSSLENKGIEIRTLGEVLGGPRR